MDLFTPGNYSVVRPNQARQVKGDSTPRQQPAKPSIPMAQPVNRKSPRKKVVQRDGGTLSTGDINRQKGEARETGRGRPSPGLHDGISKLNLGEIDSARIMYHSPNQSSDIYGHGASLPMMGSDPLLHPTAAFPQTVAYSFPADAYFQSIPMLDMTMPYGGAMPPLGNSPSPMFPPPNMPMQDGAASLSNMSKQSQQDAEKEKERIERQEKDVEEIKSMVEFIKKESTKIPFDPELHISIKDMSAKIKEIVKDKDSVFEVYKNRTIASTEAMVKDHIDKQTTAHTKEMELEAANETLKETVSQLDVECHRLEHELENLKEEGKERRAEMEKISGAKISLEEALIDSENRYGKIESENEVLATNLQKCNADLTHARQEAVVSAFKLKKVMENHKLQVDQIDRLKGTVEDLKKELVTSKANYEEIVKWAKSTEDAHRKHDDEVHDTMNKQHEKFNVEYEFLGKQNKVLKEEVRSVNHELKDAKALLEHAMEQMKDLHRESNSSKAAEKRMKKKSEELQTLVDENEHATEDLVRKFNMAKERDIEALNYTHDREIAKLNKMILAKDSTEKELTAKLEFIRKKAKDMEADIKNRDRRIVLLEEQVLFETKMREINLQKRAETEHGGLDAIVQLLKINEENKKSLDALSETNTSNLNTVRSDIETMVKKVVPDVASKDVQKKKKKKGTAKAKMKAALIMAGNLQAVREMEQGMDEIDTDMMKDKEEEGEGANKTQAQRAKPNLASLLAANAPPGGGVKVEEKVEDINEERKVDVEETKQEVEKSGIANEDEAGEKESERLKEMGDGGKELEPEATTLVGTQNDDTLSESKKPDSTVPEVIVDEFAGSVPADPVSITIEGSSEAEIDSEILRNL